MAGTVTVASKLPHGLVLQLQTSITRTEPVVGGGTRDVTSWAKAGQSVVIKGNAVRAGESRSDLTNGYALTHGVDADFFAAWLEQHKDMEAVKNGFVFAHEKQNVVEGKAKDHVKEKTGFEPIDPNNLPAEFSRTIKVKAG